MNSQQGSNDPVQSQQDQRQVDIKDILTPWQALDNDPPRHDLMYGVHGGVFLTLPNDGKITSVLNHVSDYTTKKRRVE